MLVLRARVSGGIGCGVGLTGYETKCRGWGPLIEPGGGMGTHHMGAGPIQNIKIRSEN